MAYQQKCFPLFLVSAVGSVLPYSTELWSLFRFSDFIPIIPLDFPVSFWKSPKVDICNNRRSNSQTSEEDDLPALLCVIVDLFWCALGRPVLLLELTSLPHVLYQEPIRVDCNSEWIYCNPARHQQHASKFTKHKK